MWQRGFLNKVVLERISKHTPWSALHSHSHSIYRRSTLAILSTLPARASLQKRRFKMSGEARNPGGLVVLRRAHTTGAVSCPCCVFLIQAAGIFLYCHSLTRAFGPKVRE